MAILKSKTRSFIPEHFKVKDWNSLAPFYANLLERKISSPGELKQWFKDRSELEAVIEEDAAWRYIHMTRDTANQQKLKDYTFFVSEIEPMIAPQHDKLNKKALDSGFMSELRQEQAYDIMAKLMEKDVKIFRDANVPIKAKVQEEAQKFSAISGEMTVTHNGRELTLQQAGALLEETNRELREKVYFQIHERRAQEKEKLDKLFDELLSMRHQMAVNAGFQNFRDYMFAALGRMDYAPEDCFAFHEAVKTEAAPLLNLLAQERKEALNVEELKPWDKSVDITGRPPLRPFDNPEELTQKTIECFGRLDPFFAKCIADLNERGHLDLDSRKGKAPGGYNYPLAETGAPFIFMNAAATLADLATMVHEGGHAVHSYITQDLELNNFRQTPSEVAELASMSMELLSMEHWDVFFNNPDDLRRARKEHLEQIIATLPWVAAIDKFQHWIYENPTHKANERHQMWRMIFEDYSDDVTDWSGLERYKTAMWQKQLHLYEVPFYYIEYGIAQLGALAVWKNYKENPAKAIEGYKKALQLGYTRPIPEIYKAADIRFDFGKPYIRELMKFLKEELQKLI